MYNTALIIVIIIVTLIIASFLSKSNKRTEREDATKLVREYLQPVIEEYKQLASIPVSYTSFGGATTQNKESISMCVKDHYTIEQLAYILLHEYAHVLCTSIGHTAEFWFWFQELLKTAKQKNIKVDDYFNSQPYCKI